MKCTRNLTVTILAICLIVTAAYAQSSARPHRFRVSFSVYYREYNVSGRGI